ncbi:hypothetical protein H4K36_01715 [Streptomyces sp. DHE7-1]|nr:hypothetical protein [Streptomyces sp. DHE7-1]
MRRTSTPSRSAVAVWTHPLRWVGAFNGAPIAASQYSQSLSDTAWMRTSTRSWSAVIPVTSSRAAFSARSLAAVTAADGRDPSSPGVRDSWTPVCWAGSGAGAVGCWARAGSSPTV